MLRIGLTGGIASGKSTVAALFARKGATVIDTDRIARDVVEPGMPALAALVNALGGGILDNEGRLDRAELRRQLFADAVTRRSVESILHPAILAQLDRDANRAPGPYQVLVVPLLVDGRHEGLVDRVLVVDCPEETQIRRLMERDGETRENAIRMLDTQVSRERRLAQADDVIENDGPPAELEVKVAALDRKYRGMAAER
ncbi:MAG TPA: dephospho-CoA kinase [Steroidobacteraceae bacterium]